MAEPFAQGRAGRHVLQPEVDPGMFLLHAPRPKPVYQDAEAVTGGGGLIRPLDCDCTHQSDSSSFEVSSSKSGYFQRGVRIGATPRLSWGRRFVRPSRPRGVPFYFFACYAVSTTSPAASNVIDARVWRYRQQPHCIARRDGERAERRGTRLAVEQCARRVQNEAGRLGQ